jgi:hypothetical protein
VKNKILFGFLFAIINVLCICCIQIAGTSDETVTVRAYIYDSENNAAENAEIQFFKVGDTSLTPVYTTISDSLGRFNWNRDLNGKFNIWAEKDNYFAIIDSQEIVPSIDTLLVSDTLKIAGELTGYVRLQPHHNPQTVTIQVPGTFKYANVNTDGSFTLSRMAEGRYTLRVITTLENYTPTYRDIVVKAGKVDTLKDTINLIYTGIPITTGLSAVYDTTKGVVFLKWNKVQNYSQYFQEYRIIRRKNNLTIDTIGQTTDSIFQDTTYKNAIENGTAIINDTSGYYLKYQVVIRNKSNRDGDAFYSV